MSLHRYLMGNKFTRVVPEMFQGNAENADGTFSSTKSALSKLKVMCVCVSLSWSSNWIDSPTHSHLVPIAAWT